MSVSLLTEVKFITKHVRLKVQTLKVYFYIIIIVHTIQIPFTRIIIILALCDTLDTK